MARPERKTVDYFPHYIGDGKKMFCIEQKYGNDGYAAWFKMLESMATTENHFLNLNNEMDLMFISAKCRVEKNVLISILDDLSQLEQIDHFLWMNRIVYSHKFIESIQDAYFRRSNKCMSYDGFCKHYSGLCTTITRLLYDKKYKNTQSKGNKTKVKEKRVDEKTYRSFAHLSISKDECNKLFLLGYSVDQINNILDSIENYKKNTSYKSLYLTAKKWLIKEHGEPNNPQADRRVIVPIDAN